MAAQLRILKRKIAATSSMKKITKAMELVATSRLGKAQDRVAASQPYATAITGVLTTLASKGNIDHPLLRPRPVRRVGVLLITSDSGLCGAYNANAIRTAEQLMAALRSEGKEPVLYVIGRKGVGYYKFRGRPIEASWTGFSQQPAFENAREVGEELLQAFLAGAEGPVLEPEGRAATAAPSEAETPPLRADHSARASGAAPGNGVDELHLVYTQFKSLMTQKPATRRMAPLDIEERTDGPMPAYDFEPESEDLLDALLPKYINARLYAALLDSAASELAARRRAMKAATDNAEEIVKKYTREMNSARQAAITQEISEIVGGANALAAAGKETS